MATLAPRARDREAATYTLSSVIRGHHVYKDFWMPYIHEELTVGTEEENLYDRHAVAVLKDGEVVGHMPCTISRLSKEEVLLELL